MLLAAKGGPDCQVNLLLESLKWAGRPTAKCDLVLPPGKGAWPGPDVTQPNMS